MTLLALFDSKQKNLRSELRNSSNSGTSDGSPTPELAAKLLQKCFDDMYNEYSVANSLDLRGQRELAFVLDILKESVALLLSTTVSSSTISSSTVSSNPVSSTKISSTKVVQEENSLLEVASQKLEGTQAGAQVKTLNQVTKLTRSRWANLPALFGSFRPSLLKPDAFKPGSIKIWPIAKGFLGFFLFAMLWFQSQFFAAFIVIVLGLGDLGRNLLGFNKTNKPILNYDVSVDSSKLLAAVAELVKCADKLLTEKQAVTALANPDVAMPNRLPVSLFQDLMEARYANDGDLALKRILKLPASLEDMGIIAVDYDGHNADFFDILPKIDGDDTEYETAVPALIKGDQVLARGRVYL